MAENSKIASPESTEIGKIYLVPCVYRPSGAMANNKGYVPVLTPAHSDPEFGFSMRHYHIDYRFVDKRSFESEGTAKKASFVEAASLELAWLKLRCKREPLTFPRAGFHLSKFADVEKNYADCVIDLANPVCPHKGICLKDAPIIDGVIVCPGHGFGFDAQTGRAVARHGKPTEQNNG